MSHKRNRLAWVDLQRVSGEYELDLVPFGGEEPFTAQQLPSSGRMVLGPFSREDMRTLRDALTVFLKGEKRA